MVLNSDVHHDLSWMTISASIAIALLTVLFTAVAVGAEVFSRAFGGVEFALGWKLRALFTNAVGSYFIVTLLWNGAGALLALSILKAYFPTVVQQLGPASYYLAAFAGAFILGFILSNTNVIIFSKGLLAFHDWSERLRTPAITSAKRKHMKVTKELQRQLESSISTLSEQELQHVFLRCFGLEDLQQLEEDAVRAGASKKEYKVMELVAKHPAEALSVAKQARKRVRRRSFRQAS